MKKHHLKMKLIFSGILSFVLLTGCASNDSQSYTSYSRESYVLEPQSRSIMEETGYNDSMSVEEAVRLDSEDTMSEIRTDKLVRTGHMEILVGDFEGTIADIYALADRVGGNIESYQQYLNIQSAREFNSAFAVLKVPAERYEETKNELSLLGVVRSYGSTVDNISTQYYDAQARLDMKMIERNRLLELLEMAESIEDIIAVEARLSQVNADIDILESYMIMMDRDVQFSTFYLNIEENPNESIQLIGQNLGARILESFKSSINYTIAGVENIILFAVTASVPLLIIGIIAGTGVWVYKKTKPKE